MKKLIALLLACVMVFSLVACNNETNGDETQNTQNTENNENNENNAGGDAEVTEVTLKVWAPQEDQVDDSSWLNVMLKRFEEAHPEYKITWDTGVCSEGDAATMIGTDAAAAADVFMYASDQVGTLLQAGALAQLGGPYLEQVENDNNQNLVNTVSYSDGGVYGFPVTNNTWFMYYNKTIFTEEDVKSLDTMLTKGVVAFPMTTGWYAGSFFMANGGTLFGDNGIDAAAGIQFGGANGEAAAAKMVELAANPNFKNDADGLGNNGLKDGTVGAYFSGSWDYAGLYEKLGEDLGAVQLPLVNIGGTDVQMKSFAGSKAVGVNPNADNMKAAMDLAAFLATPEAQMLRFELRGIIPCAESLAADPAVSSNMVAVAEINTMANTSVAQSTIPEMGNYWSPVQTFGENVINGNVTAENVAEQVEAMMESLNNTGL